ncbi:MAG: type 1 periplasmic binding fold superfamily protein [Flavobacteriales bacterium]|nr:type 1 periplasmic binding fold superfamily protein [Flavobacteriales bacterium]
MKKYYLFLFIALAVGFTSCDDDDDEPETPVVPVEEEVITTLTYTLTPDNGGADVVLTFQDLDGEGGNDATITGGTLEANITYSGAIVLLNEQENPAENVTEEIEEEDEEHQFFFINDLPGFSVAYGDQDENGNPIGLATTITVGDAGSGTLTVVLRHEPDKEAANVSAGDITNAGGETDIEVEFPITVQ